MIEDVRKSDLLAELTDVMSDGVSQDLWILSSFHILDNLVHSDLKNSFAFLLLECRRFTVR